MINFFSENTFKLSNEENYKKWLANVILSEEKILGEISYVFCNDAYLHKINVKFLNHDDYTDIISFDDSIGSILHGDIFISTERVKENAKKYDVSFDDELQRVLVHGILHFCDYTDKTPEEAQLMRDKENEKMNMFHVEH